MSYVSPSHKSTQKAAKDKAEKYGRLDSESGRAPDYKRHGAKDKSAFARWYMTEYERITAHNRS